jgi:GxxExxY protein
LSDRYGGKPPRKPFGSREGSAGGGQGPRRGPSRPEKPPWQRDEQRPSDGPRRGPSRPDTPPWQRDDRRPSDGPRGGPRRDGPPPWERAERGPGGRSEGYSEGDRDRPRRPATRTEVAGPPVLPPRAYKPEQLAKTAEKIVAAGMEVQRHLGTGLEPITYHRALALELQTRGIIFEREERVPVSYKGRQIDTRRVDFIIEGCLVDIRSQPTLDQQEMSRATNYLKVSGYQCAVVLNFGTPKFEYRTLQSGIQED